MENLNDVEFGSDKSKEEAPILVAQRYLNIFRQIHIFNKEKRSQFDDELLALPQNILDFFAKMPGGRLLIEHIEEVKTERGIAFVKSRKEDFIYQDASSDLQQTHGGSGGVIDASFADTLAKSMAVAFAQSGSARGENAECMSPSLLANLNKTFQLIAEELKSSRESLLEIMQENRKVVASAIASQQAAGILLENLSKGVFLTPALPSSQKALHMEETSQRQDTYNNNFSRPEVNENNNAPIQNEAVGAPANTSESQQKKKKKKHNQPNAGLSESVSNPLLTNNDAVRNSPAQNDISIKSEKIAPAFSGVIRNITSKHKDDFKNVKLDEPPLDDISFDERDDTIEQTLASPQSSVSYSVNNSASSESNSQIVSPLPERSAQPIAETIDSEIDNKSDFTLPETDNIPYVKEIEPVNDELDSLMSDGLDFALPEQNNTPQVQEDEPVNDGLDSLMSDGLDFALPEQNNTPQVQEDEPVNDGLDSLMSDGLDFALPEQNNTPQVQEDEPVANDGFDSLLGDGLDFALPEQDNTLQTPDIEPVANDRLDSLLGDGLDFALPEQNSASQAQEIESVDDGLDSLLSDGLDFALPEQENAVNVQEVEPADDGLDSLVGDIENVSQLSPQNLEQPNDSNSLDDFSEHSQDSLVSSQPEAKSRYAAELDKIREALTSDDIDISSIDTPIALDDYNDDENVSETSLDDFDGFSGDNSATQTVSAQDTSNGGVADGASSLDEPQSDNEDWEWEYVDENGNPIEATDGDDEDWEWEYVEDDGSEDVSDNNTK